MSDFFRIRASLLAGATLAVAMALGGCAGLQEDETIGWSAQKLYGEAKDAINGKDFEKGVKYLEKLEARYPYGRYAQQAQLEIAYAYWKEGERASAIAAAERFIKLYPNHVNVDYAWYLKGLINFHDSEMVMGWLFTPDMSDRDPKGAREAFASLKELVTRFPQSKYAEDAKLRMRYLVNSLASFEVHVARYYMKRGAYVAAANRAQYAITTYPQAPAIEEAVVILVRAYDALGLTDLRDGAERVMRANFPDSPYLKGAAKGASWWRIWDPNW